MEAIDYFVQAADRGQLTRRTPDYKPPIHRSGGGGTGADAGAGAAAAGISTGVLIGAGVVAVGPGTIVLSVLKGGSILQTAPQNCASQGSRTATVTLQGSQLTTGSYTVNASATPCAGQPTTTSITAVFSVLSSDGTTTGAVSTCNNVFKDIPVGASAQQVCAFSVP